MSLAVNTNLIDAVLLTDGKWYKVAKPTFYCDAYEWGYPIKGGGKGFHFEIEKDGSSGDRSPLGAGWRTPDGKWIYCSVSDIVAVQCSRGNK